MNIYYYFTKKLKVFFGNSREARPGGFLIKKKVEGSPDNRIFTGNFKKSLIDLTWKVVICNFVSFDRNILLQNQP